MKKINSISPKLRRTNKFIILGLLFITTSVQCNRDYTSGVITGIVGTLAVQATMVTVPFAKFLWDRSKRAAKQEADKDEAALAKAAQEYNANVQKILEETGQVKTDLHHDEQRQSIDEAREKRWQEASRILDQIVQ